LRIAALTHCGRFAAGSTRYRASSEAQLNLSRIRIVVDDQAEAIFQDTSLLQERPREVAHITDPLAYLPASAAELAPV